MPLNPKLRQRLQAVLGGADEHNTRGPRLLDDANRLWRRVQHFLSLNLIAAEVDDNPLELACFALQLPMRNLKTLPIGRLGRISLRDRAEQASELLVSLLGREIDEPLLDATTRLLHELWQRSPVLDEARVLADAVNLEDFGVIGLLGQTMLLARQANGLSQVHDGCLKREQYGYWEARLKDGFHFDPVREMARQRLDHTRQVCRLLGEELEEG